MSQGLSQQQRLQSLRDEYAKATTDKHKVHILREIMNLLDNPTDCKKCKLPLKKRERDSFLKDNMNSENVIVLKEGEDKEVLCSECGLQTKLICRVRYEKTIIEDEEDEE